MDSDLRKVLPTAYSSLLSPVGGCGRERTGSHHLGLVYTLRLLFSTLQVGVTLPARSLVQESGTCIPNDKTLSSSLFKQAGFSNKFSSLSCLIMLRKDYLWNSNYGPTESKLRQPGFKMTERLDFWSVDY